MIADDDVTLAENLKEYLESRGHSVFLVHDGVTASEKAQERKPDPIEKIRSRLPADHPRMRFVPKPIDLKAFEGVVRELLAA